MADQLTTQKTENRTSESRAMTRPQDYLSPFAGFRQIERLFDDFLGVFGMPTRPDWQHLRMPAAVPRMDISETENEIRVSAELPGIEEKDIELNLVDDVLTIRGETKIERDQNKENFHVVERARGGFARSLRLPFHIEAQQVQAAFKDGVLTITIPKPKEARERVQRIEVKRDQTGNAGQQAGGQAASAESRAAAE